VSAVLGERKAHFWQSIASGLSVRCWEALAGQVEPAVVDGPQLAISVAGRAVRIRVSSEVMAVRLFPALAHLRHDGAGGNALEIAVVHAESADAPAALPDGWRESAWRKSLAFCSDARRRFYYEDWLDTLIGVDLEAGRALAWYPHPDRLPLYETTAPLRAALHPWLASAGLQIVHAAAVAPPGGAAILLAGPGGSGKSTTALAALEAGWDYLGDDLCVIRGGPKPEVFSLYQFAKLRETALAGFPLLAPQMTRYEECGEAKAVCEVGERFPGRLRLQAPLGAVVLPAVAQDGALHTRIERARWTDVMRGVLPWTLKQLPGSGREVLDNVFRTLPRLPAWRVRLGRDRDLLLHALEDLVQ
jgi:hypothetical protein